MSTRPGKENRIEEILLLASKGLTDKEIATKLGVSPTTVATYWKRVRAKVGVRSRASAIAYYDNLRIQELQNTLDALPMGVAVAAEGHFMVMNSLVATTLEHVDARKIKAPATGKAQLTLNGALFELSSIPWTSGVATLLVLLG